MKELIRWLFMKAYKQELLSMKEYVYGREAKLKGDVMKDIIPASEMAGALDALDTLDLLAR
ncbi:MAG: hypothetical protein IME93_03050 [Proteobacteria bacterium]|nr:hypothetical protein [Pseudomonadota bacterium]